MPTREWKQHADRDDPGAWKKGAEMTAAKRVNEIPDFLSTALHRCSVNEANELNFCCLASKVRNVLIHFCTTGDSHNFHSSGLS